MNEKFDHFRLDIEYGPRVCVRISVNMTDQLIRNKSFDERTGKRIASFEPRERTMEIQNNHQLTVCMKEKTVMFISFK